MSPSSMDFDPVQLYNDARNEAFGEARERRDSRDSSIRRQRDAQPPPSSFVYPFQAHPGNPDPGTSMPRYGYSSRRSSFESLPGPPVQPPASPRSTSNVNQIFRNSVGAAMSDSPAIPRNASTGSFRPPFLSPASRNSLSRPNSAVWTPPQYPNIDSPTASTSALAGIPPSKPPLPSTRLTSKLTKEDKPWLGSPHRRERLSWWITFICVLLGMIGAAVVCWDGYNQTSQLMLPGKAGHLCTLLDEPWSLDGGSWVREVGTGGWGNGEFQIYTDSNENAFIKNNQLYIVPTLTTAEIGSLTEGTYTVKDCSNTTNPSTTLADLFPVLPASGNGNGNNGNNSNNGNGTGNTNSTDNGNGNSTSNGNTGQGQAAPAGAFTIPQCVAVANPLTESVIPPVKSARISTRGKKSIDGSKGGKVQIRAKLGRGDWLLNRIRLMPESPDGTYGSGAYGVWPLSGEIDMLQARTNRPDYPAQGSNFVHSALTYGPFPAVMSNSVLQSNLLTQLDGWFQMKRDGFDAAFHTYTLEWTPNFMNFYVDSRLQSTLFMKTKSDKDGFFSRAKYPVTTLNSSTGLQEVVQNPWKDHSPHAPFDQKFYLVIDLAAGGTNGMFPDGVANKPWIDGSQSAMADFAKAQDSWSNSWPSNEDDKAFRIDYVKMWQVC